MQYGGQEGVELGIKILHQELKITMALAGYVPSLAKTLQCLSDNPRCRNISEINKSHLSVVRPDGVLSKL